VPFLLYFKRNLLPSSVTYAPPFRENAIDIVIGGPTHLCGSKCKDGDCELAKNSPGLLHVFSPEGEFLYEISNDALEFPSEVEHTEMGTNTSVSGNKPEHNLFQPL
jgi:hypothetical protein